MLTKSSLEPNFPYKLGRLPKQDDERDLALSAYLDAAQIVVPPDFGHETLITPELYGNDQYGDCVWAAAAEETVLWTTEGGKPVQITEQDCLTDYHNVTGFLPDDPSTDRGTMIRDALKYRRKTGTLTTTGKRHKIGAYMSVDATNLAHVAMSAYVFSACELGVVITASAQQQFAAGQPWDAVGDMTPLGGHCVPLVARRGQLYYVFTWGRLQPVTARWLATYLEEAWAIASRDMLKAGKSPEAFDWQQLLADLKVVSA